MLDANLSLSSLLSVLPCGSPADAAALRDYVTQYADHPAQFKYDNRVFASTFAGEKCSFGQGSAQDGWKSQFYSQLNGQVFFVPALFADPGSFGSWSGAMDGAFTVCYLTYLFFPPADKNNTVERRLAH